jgi:hypothetical protein
MPQLQQIIKPHPLGEAAMHPIARISSRLALLLLLAGNDPAATYPKRFARQTLAPGLARQLEIRTLGRIQPRFPG